MFFCRGGRAHKAGKVWKRSLKQVPKGVWRAISREECADSGNRTPVNLQGNWASEASYAGKVRGLRSHSSTPRRVLGPSGPYLRFRSSDSRAQTPDLRPRISDPNSHIKSSDSRPKFQDTIAITPGAAAWASALSATNAEVQTATRELNFGTPNSHQSCTSGAFG